MKPPAHKTARTKPSKKSKAERFRIMARVLGIPEYAELAKLKERVKGGLNTSQILDREGEAHQKKGVIGPAREEKRLQEVKVTRFMERPFKELRAQPKWRKMAKGWDLFYDYLPKLTQNKTIKPLLESALLERKVLRKIDTSNEMNGPISIADMRYCIMWARRGYLRARSAIHAKKNQMKEDDYQRNERLVKRQLETANSIARVLQQSDAKKNLTDAQLETIPVRTIIHDALQGSQSTIEELIGVDEAAILRKAEYHAKQSMIAWERNH